MQTTMHLLTADSADDAERQKAPTRFFLIRVMRVIRGSLSSSPRLSMRPPRLRSEQFVKKHAGQGSNLPLPDLESGVPPLELPAYPMRREGVEPPFALGAVRVTAGCITVLPPTRTSQRGRIRTFDPVRPRHVRCQAALHADETEHAPGGNRTHHSPDEGRASWPLDDGSGGGSPVADCRLPICK